MLAGEQMQKFKPGSTGVAKTSKKRANQSSGKRKSATKSGSKHNKDGCIDILAE